MCLVHGLSLMKRSRQRCGRGDWERKVGKEGRQGSTSGGLGLKCLGDPMERESLDGEGGGGDGERDPGDEKADPTDGKD